MRKATGSFRTYLSLVKLNFGSCICSERPALVQNTLIMFIIYRTREIQNKRGGERARERGGRGKRGREREQKRARESESA